MKVCFIDTETTGVNHHRNGIIQLSAIMEIDGRIVDEFDIRVRPWDNCEIVDESLQVSGVTREEIAGFVPEFEAYQKFTGWLSKHISKFNRQDKAFFSGYNSKFDEEFIRALFARCGEVYFGSWFWSGTLDVMVFALNKLMPERHLMPNFKLGTVAEKVLGSDRIAHIVQESGGGLHNSLTDIRITRAVFQRVRA